MTSWKRTFLTKTKENRFWFAYHSVVIKLIASIQVLLLRLDMRMCVIVHNASLKQDKWNLSLNSVSKRLTDGGDYSFVNLSTCYHVDGEMHPFSWILHPTPKPTLHTLYRNMCEVNKRRPFRILIEATSGTFTENRAQCPGNGLKATDSLVFTCL